MKSKTHRLHLNSMVFITLKQKGFLDEDLTVTVSEKGQIINKKVKLYTKAEIERSKAMAACSSKDWIWDGTQCKMPLIKAAGFTWSGYLGKDSWYSAKEKCARIGMRLPSQIELYKSYQSGLKTLRKPQGLYWTSERVEESVTVSVISMVEEYGQTWRKPNSKQNVRCVR